MLAPLSVSPTALTVASSHNYLYFSANKMFQTLAETQTQTQKLWMWRLEYTHHEQRPLYFGSWF
eukprot:JP440067.1.p2 GENE.JP440067.1~~JP440067.1.p2  ORF type:complete len:64 (+),score=7.14 JP440067.1:131-322(+)